MFECYLFLFLIAERSTNLLSWKISRQARKRTSPLRLTTGRSLLVYLAMTSVRSVRSPPSEEVFPPHDVLQRPLAARQKCSEQAPHPSLAGLARENILTTKLGNNRQVSDDFLCLLLCPFSEEN